MDQIALILKFVLGSFLHIWPYLLVTIPLAVIINLSGASKHINIVFGKNPLLSVFLATVVGAFSPFCSCGVIPVISSLLIGGVPLAPVMSFWIASPSMDPEIFFLSSSMIGWKLAIWRLASTFMISLLAGYLTHYATIRGFIGKDILKAQSQPEGQFTLIRLLGSLFVRKRTSVELVSADRHICCSVEESPDPVQDGKAGCSCSNSGVNESSFRWRRISEEIFKATFVVAKFMGIAFLLTALMTLYLPDSLIEWIVSGNPFYQVVMGTLIGIPVYTSNMTALPVVGGLIDHGMNEGRALSFLISGATTTIPAMVAVWGITRKKVFLLYLSFVLFGALLSGICFNLFS